MSVFQLAVGVFAAVVLFLFGLQGFSREIQAVAGTRLKDWLARATANRIRGFVTGAIATAIVQSSSAVSSLTVALVDAGVMSFRASLGVMLGANVGTTVTAWLVSFKLTGIGPFFILLGAVLGLLPLKVRVFGKAIFYFGFIFFSLDIIGASLEPIKQGTYWHQLLAIADSPWIGLFAGLIVTAIVQSSSVTTGLAILLVQQGMLEAAAAVPIVLGANVGTTSTALLASIGMGTAARRAAVANLVFNVAGLVLFLPFLTSFTRAVVSHTESPDMAVAWAHLFFNVTVALGFLVVLSIANTWLARFDARPNDA